MEKRKKELEEVTAGVSSGDEAKQGKPQKRKTPAEIAYENAKRKKVGYMTLYAAII